MKHPHLHVEDIQAQVQHTESADTNMRRLFASAWVLFANWGWLLTGLACLILGYMLVWQRGMFLDDYSVRKPAINIITGEWLPFRYQLAQNPTFPARILTWAVLPRLLALLPTHELIARIIMVFFTGLNAFLLGLLVYRMSHSRLAGVVAGWLFLMPIYTDVTLWAGAAVYLFLTSLTLIFLHAFWTAMVQPRHVIRSVVIGSIALVASLFFAEACAVAVGFIPLISIISITERGTKSLYQRISRVVILSIIPFLILGLFLVFISRNSSVVADRGGFETNPTFILQHATNFIEAFRWASFDAGWGAHLTLEAFKVGLAQTFTTWQGLVLIGFSSVTLLLTLFTWRNNNIPSPPYARYLLIVCFGMVWFGITLLFPYILVKSQMYYERRFAYFPTAGVAIALAGLCSMLVKLLHHPIWEKLMVLLAGVVLLITTFCIVGFAQMYATRYQLDQAQVAALLKVIPPQSLPKNVQFIPLNMDQSLPGKAAGLSSMPVGAFESSWTACAILEMSYKRNDFQAIVANRWAPMAFNYTDIPNSSFPAQSTGCGPAYQQPDTRPLDSKGSRLYAQNTAVLPESAIVFTYQNGQVHIVRSLTLTTDDSQRIIHFPIADHFHADGVPTIDTVEVQETK